MSPRLIVAASLALGLAAVFTGGTRPRNALDSYRDALAAVESADRPVSLEPLFSAAADAQSALMELQPDGDRAWIETLSDGDYAALKAQLRGLLLSRGYDIYAQPDGAFFLKLAQARGRPEDQAFFRLYHGLWDAEMLPRYLSLGTRPTPCVRFGEAIIPELYADWRGFVARYPQAYTGFARQTVRDLEEAVALGVCACGDEDSVTRELQDFVRRFPDTAVADQVHGRLVELREQPDLRPVRCR